MRLRTLGGLALQGTSFTRRVPLLLLAYLALEGEQERGFLSELFWPDARDRRGALRVALARLRRAAPDVVGATGDRLRATVDSDAAELRRHLRDGAVDAAVRVYAGPFLAGVRLDASRAELEEWQYALRERIASDLRRVLLTAAEADLERGAAGRSRTRAELAFTLAGAPPAEPEVLARLHRLLRAGDSALDRLAHVEAGRYGVTLAADARPPRVPEPRVRPGAAPTRRSTPLIGRDAELRALVRRLRDPGERLTTVTGPPGVGKTRLALAATDAVAREDRGAVAVSAVAADRFLGPERIADGLAHAFGLSPADGDDPFEACVAALADAGPRLLLLDGFDALVGGASTVSALLRACPQVTALVTSRTRLHLDLEGVASLAPLVGGATDAPAVRLFVDRVRRARGAFDPDDADMEAALRICRAVGGLPLGLELAAAWTRALPVPDVADEVERSLGFLAAPTRDAPPRERSLRAAVAYSWQRLPDGARTVLLRASAFRGTFPRASAAAVARADAEALAALVDASLLDLDEDGRYRLHPVVADYARDRLESRPFLAAATRRRHRRWFVSRLGSWRARMGGGPRQRDAVRSFGEELPELRQAWEEAVAADRGAELYALARTVAMYFELAHRFREGGDVLAQSEAQLDRSNPAHVAALGGLDACWAWHHLRRGSLDAARERARTAVETLSEHGDVEGEADARHALAATLAALGACTAARSQADAALERVRADGMTRETARLQVLAASLDAAEGDDAGARERLGDAVRLLQRVDDRRSLVRTLIASAEIARRSGDREAAVRNLRTASRMADAEGMPEEGRRASTLLATTAIDAVRT